MRRIGFLILLALVLAACEGTAERPLPIMLVASDGSELRFYPSGRLRQGEVHSVGTWSLAGVQDLAAGNGLWVLTTSELRRYRTDGFTPDVVPPEHENRDAVWNLETDCSGGHLALGAEKLLVVCPGARAFLLNQNADPSTPLARVETGGFAGFDPLDLALFPSNEGDVLAVAYARTEGWHFELRRGNTPILSRDLSEPSTAEPIRLHLDPSEGTLWVLAGRELFGFDGVSLKKRARAQTAHPDRLTGDLGRVVAYGEGYLFLDGTSRSEADFTDYQAGWIDPDLYLYLASGETLRILDAAYAPPAHLKGLDLGFYAQVLTGFVMR